MALEQQRLFGASICQINATGGLNGQDSRLDITLVEDIRNGDAFIPPIIFSPVYFSYYGFNFGGILTSISTQTTEKGTTYQVIISDPRGLLNGVQLILDSYNGAVTSVPNVINVFGYLESVTFGFSELNSNGIPWYKIKLALTSLFSIGLPTVYSSGIKCRGYSFGLDILQLPTLDDNVRFSGQISLFDLISQICEMSCCDFLVNLYSSAIASGIIQIQVISRNAIPATGVITDFVRNTSGAVQKSIGLDAVDDVTSKLLIGAKRKDIYFQTRSNATTSANPIWPFWGFDLDGKPCLGTGTGFEHVFVLDARAVRIPGVGDTYPTSVGEMMAALESIESWESYLSLNNFNRYILNSRGSNKDRFVGSDIEYKHNRVRNPHFGKASAMNLDSNVNDVLLGFLTNAKLNGATNIQFDKFIELIPGKKENGIELLYNLVRDVAENYYGKFFLVEINQIRGVYDAILDKFHCNAIPTDDGYLDNSSIDAAIATNFAPVEITRLMNDDTNTIRPYVRFDSVQDLDFSEMPLEAILWSANERSIFLEAHIESDVIFLNPATSGPSSPRVVISIDGRVKVRLDDDRRFDSFIAEFLKALDFPDSIDSTKVLEVMAGSPLLQHLSEFRQQLVTLPNVAAIPLESQVSRYGPWSAVGAIGRTELEINNDLSPWNFANTTLLNTAANAIVSSSVGFLQQTESGVIEFPGIPALSIGDRLNGIGPYISQVQITIGSDGVKTTYRMEFWKNRSGAYARMLYERLQGLAKMQIRQDRNSREIVRISKKFRRNLVKKTYG